MASGTIESSLATLADEQPLFKLFLLASLAALHTAGASCYDYRTSNGVIDTEHEHY